LIIYLVTDYITKPKYTRILEFIGDAGNKWNHGVLFLGRISKPFRIVFSAERFWNEAINDVALDDIKLLNCAFPSEKPECPATSFICDRKACVSYSDVCDLTDDCGDNSDENNCVNYNLCDFEINGFCFWRNGNALGPNYAVWQIGAYYNTFGPPRDHTTGLSDGRYAILKGSNNQKALLVTPIFKATNQCEFRVFVYIWAKTAVGGFNVYSRTASNGGDRLLLSIKRRIGEYWQKQIISITESVSFQIVVEGVSTNDPFQFVAIDDTSFDSGCIIEDNYSDDYNIRNYNTKCML
jgi:hypothetical protein